MTTRRQAASYERLSEVDPTVLREVLASEQERLERLREAAARWLRNEASADEVVQEMTMEVLW